MDEPIRQYLEHIRYNRARSENTVLAYKRDLDQFVSVLKKAGRKSEPETIPVETLEYYLEWLTMQNYKPSTIARKCAAVRGFIEFWHSDEILHLNYIDNQLKDLGPAKRSPLVLTKEQIKALLEAPMGLKSPLGLRDTAILFLMYETGLRATDIIQLLVEDVDLLGKRIRPISLSRKLISIGDAAEHLEKYLIEGRPHLARIPEENSLFLNQRGKGLTRQGIWFIVRRWAEAAQLDQKISPNTVRHSLVQHLIKSGVSKKDILRRVGLKSPNSLRVFNISQRKVSEE